MNAKTINTSATVDVLAVMESDAHCAKESRQRHYDSGLVAAASAKSAEALAAVVELIEAAAVFEAQDRADGRMGSARLRVALARCKGAQE